MIYLDPEYVFKIMKFNNIQGELPMFRLKKKHWLSRNMHCNKKSKDNVPVSISIPASASFLDEISDKSPRKLFISTL